MNKIPSTIALAIIAFAALCAMLVFGLVFTNHDPGPFITFILSVVPVTIGVVAVAAKVDKVQETADEVHHQVNGKLDAKFAALHTRLDAAGVPPAPADVPHIPEQRGRHEQPTDAA